MDSVLKPTVLIHGYAFDHRIWYPVELAFEGHHVIYLSLPGFGMDPITESYTIEELAKKYWKHLDEVMPEPVHLVGHSMGGYVCMEMIAQRPERVASLAMIHSHVFEDPAEKKEARTNTVNDIRENGKEAFVKKMISSLFGNDKDYVEVIDMLIRRGMYYDDNAWMFGTQAIRDRSDHTQTLKNIKVPVLMIMGEQDKAVTPELAYKQAPLSERVTLHMYPGVGHLSMYENTSKLIQDLVRFYEAA
ncbi:MAG TPA: alpha/beta hydrolase [Saprospiraceae bacterium]|nr:alpha/beta hydrolase [Saprospiraceae bacterium]